VGQEIVYCFKCQKRIVGTDYAKGLAFQLENNSCCSGCAVQVLDTLPPKAKEQLLSKMFKATQEHQSTNPTSSKGKSGPGREQATRRFQAPANSPSSTHIPAIAPASKLLPVYLGGGALAVAVLVLIVALNSGGASPPPAPPVTIKPPPSTEASLSPEEKRRAESAKEALRKAREFAQAHPADLEAQAQQWRLALLDAERTGFEADVRRELDRTQARAKEAAAQELLDLGREVRRLADRKEFKSALDLLARERPRRGAPEWVSACESLERELRGTSARLFAELKGKAVAARDRGAQEEMAAARAEVARWGLADLVSELNAALEEPWRPIFDGRTLGAFSSGVDNSWRVEDGVLVHDNKVDNAAVTRELFGEGEIRLRFEVRGSSWLAFRFRLEGKGHYSIELKSPALAALEGGEHELLVSCRNDAASATLDGKPMPVTKVGPVSRTGRIQFNTSDGSMRVRSLEFRNLR
jgi:hypothetical protein